MRSPADNIERQVVEGSRLIDREFDLELIGDRVASTSRGQGGSLLISSAPGLGRTSLVEAARQMAWDRLDWSVHAHGMWLERAFPYGVVTQILDAIDDLHLKPRPNALRQAAREARRILAQGGGSEANVHRFDVARVVLDILSSLPSRRSHGEIASVALSVDDLQWVDQPSVAVLAYVGQRAPGRGLLLVTAQRDGSPTQHPTGVARLQRLAGRTVVRPGLLGLSAASTLVRRTFPKAADDLCTAFNRVCGGNPLMLRALLDALRAEEQRASFRGDQWLTSFVPDVVSDWIQDLLDEVTPDARRLADAVAVLGESPTLRVAYQLSGLTRAAAETAADQLVSIGLLATEPPLRFEQPLAASAVLTRIRSFELGRVHRHAAELLLATRAEPRGVIPHILASPSDLSPHFIPVLRREASRLVEADSSLEAVPLLERALAESVVDDVRSEITAELAIASAKAGLDTAEQRLDQAHSLVLDPARHALIDLERSQLLYSQGRYEDAAAILESALVVDNDFDSGFRTALLSAYVRAASMVARRQTTCGERGTSSFA